MSDDLKLLDQLRADRDRLAAVELRHRQAGNEWAVEDAFDDLRLLNDEIYDLEERLGLLAP